MNFMRDVLDPFREDLKRHHALREPGVWSMAIYRLGRYAAQLPPGWWRNRVSGVHRSAALALSLATRSSISSTMTAGEGLHFVHAFNVTIGPGVTLGDRVGIMQDVTIDAGYDGPGVPRIGNNVFIGAGASILGPVTVGDGATIGANSVVLSDVPAGAFAIGVPAKLIRWGKPAP